MCYRVNRLFVQWDWKTVSHYDKLRLQYTIVYLNLHSYTHLRMQQHTHKYLSLTGCHSISVHCFFLCCLYRLISFSTDFLLLTYSLPFSLSLHTSIFPSLFIPPTVGIFVMEQQKVFPCFFSLLVIYTGGGEGGKGVYLRAGQRAFCVGQERGKERRKGERRFAD